MVDVKDWEDIRFMRDALYADEKANELLTFTRNKFEVEHFWEFDGVPCKCKIDIENPIFLADLKGLENADPNVVLKKIFSYEYYRQGGMYMDGSINGAWTPADDREFYFIVVEKSPPWGVSVNRLTPEVVAYGVREYRSLVRKYKAWEQQGFPGYSAKSHFMTPGIFDVTLPDYLK